MAKKEVLEPSHLKSHIGYRLRIVSNAVSHSFAKKLATLDVTVAEWVILREMYSKKENTSPSTVSEITGLTRGAVSKLIDRLLHKGLVTRTEATEDRRYQDIRLTAKAIRLVPKLSLIADENDAVFFSLLSSSERDLLMKTLVKLAEQHKLNTNPIE
ncbi:MarR family winged helix-turn-helix transcriptional regulator [Leptospira terpstrae]|uniref:MarR family protein n=1 Tax=Leptospira terpstrae serovar Hualin str. LT 11-33 = ATCC 700639 TaxID=1257025 RepID=N1W0J3_9LEPT|nr:MarR family transcriptional regulator [Leptospira terpstrae]EMY61201.1 MarR family protein [Leptospira terpstrae serovar Hualin str. LT 11-33 = ATCC 700639]